MATVKVAYAAATAITWTIDSLGSSTTVGQECTAIDNTSNLYDDYRILIKIVYPNAAPGNDQTVYVWAGGYDGTTGYAGSPVLTGSNAALTLDVAITTAGPSLRLAGAFQQIQNKTRVFEIPSIATVFGGNVPPKFGLFMLNYSGQTLSTGCSATQVGVTYTVA